MDARLTTRHDIWRLLITAIVAVALTMALTIPASAGSLSACRAQNTDTGRTYTRLQTAVDAAKPGARLIVKGTCRGGTFINKDLVIVGKRTTRTGKPVLDGKDKARVLTIKPTVKVSIRSLLIRNGKATRVPDGGGISNKGRLTLRDVVVRGNVASRGGGIHNEGILRMLGATRIRANQGADGSGVYNAGTLTLNDSSSILHHAGGCGSSAVVNTGSLTLNDASSIHANISACDLRYQAVEGGGVHNTGSLTLNDASSIHDNRADDLFMGRRYTNPPDTPPARGGGVYNAGTVTMTGSGHITANEVGPVLVTGAPGLGGGLYDASGGSLIGVTCGPGGNVYGNTPDDCYIG